MSPKQAGARAFDRGSTPKTPAIDTGSDNVCYNVHPDPIQRRAGGLFEGLGAAGVSTIEARFWSKVNKTTGCWLWTASKMDRYGHGQFTFRARGRQHHVYAHRVAWELTRESIPAGLCVCHHCDVPACVNPDHLFLGTQADNLADARRKGRLDPSLPRDGKLTLADRLAISAADRRYGAGRRLARQYGVSPTCISLIWRGRFAGAPDQALQASAAARRAGPSRGGRRPSRVRVGAVGRSAGRG